MQEPKDIHREDKSPFYESYGDPVEYLGKNYSWLFEENGCADWYSSPQGGSLDVMVKAVGSFVNSRARKTTQDTCIKENECLWNEGGSIDREQAAKRANLILALSLKEVPADKLEDVFVNDAHDFVERTVRILNECPTLYANFFEPYLECSGQANGVPQHNENLLVLAEMVAIINKFKIDRVDKGEGDVLNKEDIMAAAIGASLKPEIIELLSDNRKKAIKDMVKLPGGLEELKPE